MGKAVALEALGKGLKHSSYMAIPLLVGKSVGVTLGIDDTETPEQDFAAIVVSGLVTNALGRVCRAKARDLNERLPE